MNLEAKSRAKSKSRGGVWILLLLVAAVIAVGWQVKTKQALWDESRSSGELEAAVNDVLSQHHISDAQVIRTERHELKTPWPLAFLWVQTDREIVLPAGFSLAPLIAELKNVADLQRFGVFVFIDAEESANLAIGKSGQIFQQIRFKKLRLETHAQKPAAEKKIIRKRKTSHKK